MLRRLLEPKKRFNDLQGARRQNIPMPSRVARMHEAGNWPRSDRSRLWPPNPMCGIDEGDAHIYEARPRETRSRYIDGRRVGWIGPMVPTVRGRVHIAVGHGLSSRWSNLPGMTHMHTQDAVHAVGEQIDLVDPGGPV